MTKHTSVKKSLIDSSNIIEHCIIILLDTNINRTNENTKNSFHSIQHMVTSFETFNNIDEFSNYLKTIKDAQIFLIVVDLCDQEHILLNDLIKETTQINSVYIFCNDSLKDKSWTNESKKIKGIFTDIDAIINAIEQNINSSETNYSKTSIISTVDTNFDELDPSYMYSKILIEIILKISYDDKAKQDSFDYCRKYYADNNAMLKAIDEFEQDYQNHSPIWWYTKESPIYILLKDALMTDNIDMIVKMGFFIRDVHQDIKKIYSQIDRTVKFIVYRGQGMLDVDFDKLIKQKGGLFSYHGFLSTSTNQEIAFSFANAAKLDDKKIGILFEMNIDPLMCSIPFAPLDNASYYLEAENEVLFSTHSIFRIGEINQIEDRLWKINLTLTCDMDEQMKCLTYHMRNEIHGITPWHSLATFLYKMGKYHEALEIFYRIVQITNDDDNDNEKFMTRLSSNYNNIGLMHDSMENYSLALSFYEKALEIQKHSLPSEHPSLATVYDNIGMVYRSLGDYTTALSYCEKALEIRLKSSPLDHISLISAYSNIGMIYESKGDYSNALSFYKKAYEIQKSSFPLDHPSLTLSYNSFGGIYSLLGDYSKALLYYTKTIEIQEKSLPSNHPTLALTYNNIAYVYQLMGKYTISLSYYEEALKVQDKIPSPSQLSLATTYNNIGLVHRFMENYQIAISYFEKSLLIEEKYLKADHPSLAHTYNNLGTVYQSMKEYSTALTYYKKTLEIWQKSLPSNHSFLATIHNNMGSVYDSMGDYKQALSNYEISVEIQQTLSLKNYLDLASTYNNMGEAYRAMGDYPSALSYYQKTLVIERKHLSGNHPSLAFTISNMAVAFEANNQHEEAYEHAEQAVDIFCQALGPKHSQTIINKKYCDQLRQKLLSLK
ncbi:unnamed protein product [Rotaria sp. Silwood1]|nr:unnamed protein product [Rotaria sp. Silwood1]CAF3507411.1 unnamed protein product [Rotaria sp. Silwood1]CAF3526124.1 unnamed protein product [Rotaria sp. Silwood1]CAF3531945.1 unnamed protein product [Rotaria sp. Silwood1]CAF4504269.1 unnamed protein product [Rotaria sp. Silwood1]